MDIVQFVVALVAVLPAYLPNSAAVITGGGPPIDGGRTWRGDRVLGDGKTWRGAAGGIGAGVLLALVLNAVVGALGASWLPTFSARAAVGLAMGAVLGDMAASFVKRRTGRERGAPFPGVDQLDFLVGALVVVLVLDPDWALSTFTPAGVVFLLVATPLVHLGANRVAYWTGLKDEPW